MFFSFKAKRFALIIICIISVLIIAGFAVPAAKAKIEKMNSVKVPVIAYHSFIKDKALWNDETISPAEFESDLIWLKDHGYQTIFADDIVSYLNGGADLPEKPVMITIDNSMYNCYYYAFALLKKYNMKATVSVVGSCTEFACEEANPNIISSYLDWDNIAEMKRSGLVSFANQSYALNKKDDREGILMKNGEDYDDYRHVLSDIQHVYAFLTFQSCSVMLLQRDRYPLHDFLYIRMIKEHLAEFREQKTIQILFQILHLYYSYLNIHLPQVLD